MFDLQQPSGPLSLLAAMTTTTTAQALTTKQPGDIVSDMIGSVSFTYIQIDPHFNRFNGRPVFFYSLVRSFTDSQQTIFQKMLLQLLEILLEFARIEFFFRTGKIVYF